MYRQAPDAGLIARVIAALTNQQPQQQPQAPINPVNQALDPLVLTPQVAVTTAPVVDAFGYAKDPAAIQAFIAQQNYAQPIAADDLGTFLSDPVQIQGYINQSVQAGVAQALAASMKHTNQYADHRFGAMQGEIPAMLQQQQTMQLFAADPMFAHPSMATTRDSLISSFKAANPTATPQATYEYAQQHVKSIAQVMNTQAAANAPATAQTQLASQQAAALDF